MIIPDRGLMDKYRKTLVGLHMHLGNIFGNVASEAAYTHGHAWLDEMMVYIQGNIDLVMNFCHERLPQIKPLRPEGNIHDLARLPFDGHGREAASSLLY
jgi:cystathionine beta-lyase